MTKTIPTLDNKILATLDTMGRLMTPISGDILVMREAKENIRINPDKKIRTYTTYIAAIALKYVALGYLAYEFIK